MRKNRNKALYLKELSILDYGKAPELIQKLFDHLKYKEPMDKIQIQKAVHGYPDYFEWRTKPSFSDRFKRLSNLKEAYRIDMKNISPGTVKMKGEAGAETAAALGKLIQHK
jgi:hypothetical protein